jgi:hypothetical protein
MQRRGSLLKNGARMQLLSEMKIKKLMMPSAWLPEPGGHAQKPGSVPNFLLIFNFPVAVRYLKKKKFPL